MDSYRFMLLTLLRVCFGLLLGIILGVGLGILAHTSSIVHSILSQFITVIRSTPVASFIVVLWVIFSGDVLSVFVAFLMVMPIIWQSTVDGFNSIDKSLEEVALIFRFGYMKRLRLIVFPALLKFLLPSIITSVGLAWKAEIAAEIIAYTKNSIGQEINDAKYFMETPRVFAWTVIVILFSIILERTTKFILLRFKNEH
jgi:NitT/TauT family transport system permease protein